NSGKPQGARSTRKQPSASRRHPRRCRPGLERLEDRLAPAIAIEDFAGYAAGALTGKNSGLGWGAPWAVEGANQSAQVAVATSLGTVNTAASVPPVAEVTLAADSELQSVRPLAAAVSGRKAVYVAALVQVDLPAGLDKSSGGVGLYDGATRQFFIG